MALAGRWFGTLRRHPWHLQCIGTIARLGRFLCQSSFLNFFVWLASLTHVNLPNMNVKHLAQERLFRKTIAYEIKSHSRAKRAPRTQEVMFRLGFQD